MGLKIKVSDGSLKAVHRPTPAANHGFWRGPHNTGVPSGTILSSTRFGIKVTTDNQTYTAQHFIGTITNQAVGTKFVNCLFEGVGLYAVTNAVTSPITFEYCTFRALEGQSLPLLLGGGPFIAKFCHFDGSQGAHDCVRFVPNAELYDSYLHHPRIFPGTHNDGGQTTYGSGIRIMRNHIANLKLPNEIGANRNSAIQLSNEAGLGDITDVVIQDNFLRGGAYTIAGAQSRGSQVVTNVTFAGNLFTNEYDYGAINPNNANAAAIAAGYIFTDNFMYDTGVLIP